MEVKADAIKFRVGAPSKCLITGGYLILKPGNMGVVVGLNAYFWADVCLE